VLSEEETSLPVNQTMQLNYTQNTFKISFSVLDYALSDLVEFGYKLEGLEERWYPAYDDNTVTFRNIPYGSYKFKIKSKIRNQLSKEQVSYLLINISPPIWLSWWAKLVYLLMIAAVVIAIMHFYKRKLDLENSLLLEKKNHQQEHELNMERLSFFTNITHELRTPLTLILGPLEDLIAEKNLSSRQTAKLSTIHKSTTRLLNLINQILEFRKTETQNKKLTVRRGKLDLLVRETWMRYKELNPNKDILFNLEIAKDDYEMYFDAEVITIILDNLISNAMKYSEKGKISIRLCNITTDNKKYTEITVSDTGRGIHPEALPRIFDRYYQERKSFQKSGTGIGLALVQNLVKLHHGQIEVSSVLGLGSCFTFRIGKDFTYTDATIASPEEHSIQETLTEQAEDHSKGDSQQIILVIEDNEEINSYIAETLSEQYQVHSAYNGIEGLEKAFELIPDVIVCDVMMPELDGFSVTKKLKQDIRTSHIPIILLTAKDTIEDKTEGYELGAESYLTKPFSGRLLITRIHNLLKNRQLLAERFSNKTVKAEQMTDSLSTMDKEFIEQVDRIIEENIDSDTLDVNFLANKVSMSHSSLYRKIKALTNMTANEYIRKIRIQKAEELLVSGRYTVSEICYMVGMSSTNYFRRCFKEEFGMTPSDYLKSISNQADK
jgi:signal transduction histidine kinase/DNA-binding response OmpR family regulator